MADSRTRSRSRYHSRSGGRGIRDRRPLPGHNRSHLDRHRRSYRHRAREQFRTPKASDPTGRANTLTIPNKWHGDDYFDTQKEYGLKFPRHVESTQYSRRVNLAGRDVRLYEVLGTALPIGALRLVAGGRFVTFEAFRTRVDATFASLICCEMFKDDRFDFSALVNHHIDFHSPSCPKTPTRTSLFVWRLCSLKIATLMDGPHASPADSPSRTTGGLHRHVRPRAQPPCKAIEPPPPTPPAVITKCTRGTRRPLLANNHPDAGTGTKMNAWSQECV